MNMDDEEYISLCQLFQTNSKIALGYCETILSENYDSFDQFIADQISQSNPSSCQAAWSDKRLVVHCKECAISSSSCICLDCYNKSDHKNHHVTIRTTSGGNCSCGNPLSWKESGFCSCHHSPDSNPETTQLTKELCDTLLIIFSAAFYDINFRATYQPLEFIEICKWTKRLAGVNDGFRRCIVIALLKKSDFKQLLLNIDANDIDVNYAMVDLFMSLLTDKIFLVHFAQTVYKLQIDYVHLYLRFMRNKEKPKLLKPIINLTSHAYTPLVFTKIIQTCDFDWSVLVVSFFQIIVKLLEKDPNGNLLFRSKLNRIAANVLLLSETAIISHSDISNTSKNRIQLLFNSLAVTFSTIEGLRPFSYITPSEKDDFTGLNTFNFWCSQLTYMFTSTPIKLAGDLIFTSIFRFFIDYFISDKFDTDKKIQLFKRSIKGTALFSPIIPNHLFLSALFYQHRKRLPEFIGGFIHGALSLTDFSLLLSVLPLRWLVACHSSMTRVIPVGSRGINFLVKNFMYDNMLIYSFVPVFSLVQVCFALMPRDKDPFIAELSFVYSLYDINGSDDSSDEAMKKNQRFAFFFMIICLMTDNFCFERDYVGIGREMLSNILFTKPTSVGIINKTIAPICLDKMSLPDELDRIAVRVKTKKGNLFKLKDEKGAHPFQPWQKLSQVINHISLAKDRGIDITSQFPQIREDVDGLTFGSALNSSTLKMWLFITLADSFLHSSLRSVEMSYTAINLLLLSSKKFNNYNPEDKRIKNSPKGPDGRLKCYDEPFEVESYEVFKKLIAQLDFMSFMWTRFELPFLDFSPISMVEILVGTGFSSYIEKMNIGYIPIQDTSDENSKKDRNPQKERARKLKDMIENDFKNRQKNFNSGGIQDLEESNLDHSDLDEQNKNLCNICKVPHKNDQLCFPCLAYYTIIPSLIIDSSKPVKQFCLRICPHLVHNDCVQIGEGFRCPVDRMIRSCLLPKFDNEFNHLNSEQANIIKNFRKTPIFATRTNNQFEALANALIGTILIDESRLRMNPGCLDARVNYLLYHNLFLLLWHSHHSENLILTSDFKEWDPFKLLVSKMIYHDNPINGFFETAKSIATEIKSDKDILLFLRRATIFEVLAINSSNKKIPPFVDWDDCLAFKSLSLRFLGSFDGKEEIDLPVFCFMNLPKQFLDFAKPPYNYNIQNSSAEIALCLLTGKLVSMERKGSSFNDLAEHLQENCHSNATLLLLISGKKASALCLAGKQFNSIRTLPGIYVDKYGDEDIGFERGELLYLNVERLERYTDMLISGEWTDLDTPD